MTSTDLANKILDNYQVRKNKTQKLAFFDYVKALCDEHGYECRLETSGKLIKNRNIVIGDIEKAKYIFTAHYDTCPVLPFPNFASPRNIPFYILYQLLLSAVIIIAALAIGALFGILFKSTAVFIFTSYVIIILELIQMICGIANKHTANDNTSGVVAALSIAVSVPDADRYKYAYVLFDNEEVGLLGSNAFNSAHKKTLLHKYIVNMDCVSDGDNILFFAKKAQINSETHNTMVKSLKIACEKYGKTLVAPYDRKTFFPSDQANFKNGFAVAAMRKRPIIGLYIDRIHTNRDTVMDISNIDCLTEFALELLKTTG